VFPQAQSLRETRETSPFGAFNSGLLPPVHSLLFPTLSQQGFLGFKPPLFLSFPNTVPLRVAHSTSYCVFFFAVQSCAIPAHFSAPFIYPFLVSVVDGCWPPSPTHFSFPSPFPPRHCLLPLALLARLLNSCPGFLY